MAQDVKEDIWMVIYKIMEEWLFIKKKNVEKLNHFIQKYVATSDRTISLLI